MAKQIICKVNMFSRMQQVFIKDLNNPEKDIQTFWMPFADMSEFISKQDGDISVILSGPKDYVSQIERDTNTIEMIKFNRKRSEFKYI